MEAARVAGWHGKLPALGDFATRRLDPDFVEPWDAWLSDGLARLRRTADWLERYLASPSWRFLLMPGVLPGDAGKHTWAGVLMPSVDRVGRYYPLTLALTLPALPANGPEIEALWNWLVRLDEAAADALHEDWSIDALEAELERLPLPSAGASSFPAPLPVADVRQLALNGMPHAGMLLSAQAASAWADRARGLAYWSAHPDVGSARVLCSNGLERTRLVEQLLGTSSDQPA